VDVQTAQSQPIIGTPLLVPVPRKVIFKEGWLIHKNTKGQEVSGLKFKVLGLTTLNIKY